MSGNSNDESATDHGSSLKNTQLNAVLEANQVMNEPPKDPELYDSIALGASPINTTTALPSMNDDSLDDLIGEPPQHDDAEFSNLTENDSSNRIVNFPNGNSSSSFPDLSAPDDKLFPESLEDESRPRNISPPKSSKSQERRNRAEEINCDNKNFKPVPKFNYKYKDIEDFQTEIEEWFLYEDNSLFADLRQRYLDDHKMDFALLPHSEQIQLLDDLIKNLESSNKPTRTSSIFNLAYISLGSYDSIESTTDHIEKIIKHTSMLWKAGILEPLFRLIVEDIDAKIPEELYQMGASGKDSENSESDFNETGFPSKKNSLDSCPDDDSNECEPTRDDLDQELFILLTIFYFIIESNRSNTDFSLSVNKIDPPVLLYFVKAVGRLRWGLPGNLPLRPIFLVFWKCMVCLFGDDDRLNELKRYMRKKLGLSEDLNSDIVTASPLDYHAFRQDILSRYPSYIPPISPVPKNLENSRSVSHFIEIPRPVIAQPSNNALPTPTVHIATPAPSPPASPAITGQKVRKSVFMTNQSFPFIHPTDDNVPLSIIEASELFSSRVHTTPAMVQLWTERDKFMQQERGWVPPPSDNRNFEPSSDEEVILERIDRFYINAMPHLNSFVLVLLKFLLANASFSSSENHIDTYLATHDFPGTTSRAKDIGLKAVSASLIVMANWFKVSHICKFEFLSTLLFDSRYYLLVFKYFYSHSPLEKAIQILDSPFEGMFYVCRNLSRKWKSTNSGISQQQPLSPQEAQFCQEITVYSRRYFFTTITLLRLLRKIIRKKTQRIIVVAELPPQTLKKALTIFQQDIWEIVLEIFKEQVPFNGRKWRSNNMDLVSAIYLHCKAKLRDEWLVGGDVNAEVDDAQPQEIAIRALVEFYNERIKKLDSYKLALKSGDSNLEYKEEDPPDFFSLELDALAIDAP